MTSRSRAWQDELADELHSHSQETSTLVAPRGRAAIGKGVTKRSSEAITTTNEAELRLAAKREIEARAMRERYLPEDLCDGATWNILVDLFVNRLEERDVSISSSCLAARVPTSTALRHINDLVRRGWCRRTNDASDGRRCWLELTDTAVAALSDYFSRS